MRERADGKGIAKALVPNSPKHMCARHACTVHRPSLWCRLPCPPLLCVLAAIFFAAAPTTCSGPRPPSPPSPALPLSHPPLAPSHAHCSRTAHSHARQSLASRLLAARLLVCSVVCSLALCVGDRWRRGSRDGFSSVRHVLDARWAGWVAWRSVGRVRVPPPLTAMLACS